MLRQKKVASVQYLTKQFWSRWRKEYLAKVNLRQQWHASRTNVQVVDLVIVKEEWPE